MDCFDEHGRPAAVDDTHPVDLIEPNPLPPVRDHPDLATILENVVPTFYRGDPKITVASWKFLLGHESRSIRKCAEDIGCTPQAISTRIQKLAERYGYPISDQQKRAMQSEVASRSWAKRRRRRATRPPAAADEQLEDNSPSPKKGGRP
jgi:biotin operon repressor